MLERAPDLRGHVKVVDNEGFVPEEHLLRKIDRVVDFERVYGMVEHLYSEDTCRPAADPVVLVKMALLQHLLVAKIDMNIAYRWFLHYDLDTPIPHFATVSYAFVTRFPSELFEEMFLDAAVERKTSGSKARFIDATHINARGSM